MSSPKWFSVHVCMYLSVPGGSPRTVPVWENVFLVTARGPGEAKRKGERIGKRERTMTGLTWGGKRARLLFGGVRKVVACAAATNRAGPSDVVVVHSGMEASYFEFGVPKNKLRKFLRGDPVQLVVES
jgi:hypothetical protein